MNQKTAETQEQRNSRVSFCLSVGDVVWARTAFGEPRVTHMVTKVVLNWGTVDELECGSATWSMVNGKGTVGLADGTMRNGVLIEPYFSSQEQSVVNERQPMNLMQFDGVPVYSNEDTVLAYCCSLGNVIGVDFGEFEITVVDNANPVNPVYTVSFRGDNVRVKLFSPD